MKLIPLKENPKIFRDDKWRLYTKNLVKGQSVYGEKLIEYKGEEYREWIANRSKLAAAIKKKIGKIPIEEGDKVLYLGIAAGTTASHISDIIGWKGLIYGIDVAPRILIELMKSIGKRKNIIPILADASKPDLYLSIVPKVDLVYQDIAQPHQVKILINNVDLFLKNKGYVFFAVKARSIDVSKDPRLIFDEVGKELEEYGFKIVNKVRLEPYHKDHMMFLLQK
ncbi:MAG: fibrillarin [Candidatus Nanoclepta minutus]|uniref:Fibrillarin-like rRNA/tRNA 2'-O-methyltransferase n=1 Tax=Candidatus Nanoclepta minutus TaxID=1940235 RepID=A0A397WR45_9ARCH|nr:MAG: fibrillarin [Candidatus Nanoclepta minutus]